MENHILTEYVSLTFTCQFAILAVLSAYMFGIFLWPNYIKIDGEPEWNSRVSQKCTKRVP